MKLALLPLAAIALTACESKAGTGALVGTGLGAGTGALISPTPAGILIGAGVGAVSGAAIGAALDSNDKENVRNTSPKTAGKIDRGETLSTDDIIKMTQAGVTDDKIIATIQSSGSVFYLSSTDVQELKRAGVSMRVIDYMKQTSYQ